jgi:hypothetical protein
MFAEDGTLVLDLEPELSAPVDQGGFGDLQILGDAIEAPTLGTEEDKPLLLFDIIHSAGMIHVLFSGASGTNFFRKQGVPGQVRRGHTQDRAGQFFFAKGLDGLEKRRRECWTTGLQDDGTTGRRDKETTDHGPQASR